MIRNEFGFVSTDCASAILHLKRKFNVFGRPAVS